MTCRRDSACLFSQLASRSRRHPGVGRVQGVTMLKSGSKSSISPAKESSTDRVAVQMNLASLGKLTRGRSSGCSPTPASAALAGHGELGVWRYTAASVEHAPVHPDRPCLVQVSEGEVDAQVDLGRLVADDVDSGEVEQDVDGHGEDGARAGGRERGGQGAFAQFPGRGEEDARAIAGLRLGSPSARRCPPAARVPPYSGSGRRCGRRG